MKIKTKDLTGSALDWAVAKATQIPLYQCGEGWPGNHVVNEESLRRPIVTVGLTGHMLLEGPKASENKEWSPSTDWAQGGALIEREITKIFRNVGGTWSAMILKDVPIPPEDRGTSLALTQRMQWNAAGVTPLIAAMRCFCASRLGDEINIPEELK